MNINKIIEEIKRELSRPDISDYQQEAIPKWLEYDEVCDHDDLYLCEHRYDYMISKIREILEGDD